MNEMTLGDWAKAIILGTFILAGLFSPLFGYMGYQAGSRKSAPSVNVLDERRNGASQMCLYFAVEAEIPPSEAAIACKNWIAEVVK